MEKVKFLELQGQWDQSEQRGKKEGDKVRTVGNPIQRLCLEKGLGLFPKSNANPLRASGIHLCFFLKHSVTSVEKGLEEEDQRA